MEGKERPKGELARAWHLRLKLEKCLFLEGDCATPAREERGGPWIKTGGGPTTQTEKEKEEGQLG